MHKHKDGFTYRADRFKADPKALYSIARAERLGADLRARGRYETLAQSRRFTSLRQGGTGYTRISARLGK